MPKSKKKPVISIFYSYAHADWKKQQQLHEILASLKHSRSFTISQWYDGEINPGDEFEEAIARNIRRADIILLLLTPAFVDSDYCYVKELNWALEQHKRGKSRVIPVLLKEVAWRDRKFNPFQALPQSKTGAKPLGKWRPRSEGVKAVRDQLRQEIQELLDAGPATDVSRVAREMQDLSAKKIEQVSSRDSGVRKKYASVMHFWADRDRLEEGDLVELTGTFSEFAPLLIGYPKAKRRLHLEFRRALEKNPKLAKFKVRTINACMSISAGQMVYRDRDGSKEGVFCGVYESIVRNSIPIFITREYYESTIRKVILDKSADTFEAKIVGRVTKRKMGRLRRFIEKHGMDRLISQRVIDDLCKNSLGLLVSGKHTSISYKEESRYLDGDIWIAGEERGAEFFETTFLDIGDPNDREDALVALRDRLEQHEGTTRLVAQYDDASQLTKAGIDVSSEKSPLEKIFQYGFDPTLDSD